ncbi:uncharacterized protein LOC123529209 [Mercenaria mercenaria]|uniref:uncharacterized protein LOC123529209 n=1 Tax=Mercenaria mercenaria TaxID=6596 RepID=UPI00234F023A|nr:uncharacterized protein LOC123529209 [Mercenaria mercenaria]
MSDGLKMYVAVCLLWVVLCPSLLAQKCKDSEFFDASTQKCKKCSTCPDQLLSKTCSETSDTLCGLHINFSFLDSQSSGNEDVGDIGTPTVLQSDDEERYWKSLAFALIAVLSALVILTTIVVIVTCHRVRNYTWLCKGVTQEQGEDAESGYVIIHRFIPPTASPTTPGASGQNPSETHPFISYQPRNTRNGAYRPKRRLMNEYVDDVFESDDSGGSRTLRLPLATIPEKSDSDNPESPNSPISPKS